MFQKLNHELGVFICWITRKHRTPFTTVRMYPYEVDFCNRCGHISNKRKIGMTFAERFEHEWNNSGNQIW